MGLIAPIWLFALAAISIPVVIHLWNIRPGRTLKVGSIALFNESSPISSRSFKITDLLLLALRCLMIALIAFLLAGPTWKQDLGSTDKKGYILIPEARLGETYRLFKHSIDPLIKAGYEPHYFKQNFQKIDLEKDLQRYPDSLTMDDSLNYWAAFRQLLPSLKAVSSVHIFSPNTLYHFTGDRPSTPINIQWHTFTPTHSGQNGAFETDTTTWIAGAWLTGAGDIRMVKGIATSKGTSFDHFNIPVGSNSSEYTTSVSNTGELYIRSKMYPDQKVKVDTATKRIGIYADHQEDANYVRAALRSVAQLTQQKTDIKIYRNAATITAGQDWLFWLSDKPVSVKTGEHKDLFTYERGKVIKTDGWLSSNGPDIALQGEAQIANYQIIADKQQGEPVWADSYGRSVLDREAGKTNVYHFYSRLNPQWNGLVWSDEFPKWMLSLTSNLQPNATTPERRALSDEQIHPVYYKENVRTAHTPTNNKPIGHYFWMILVIVFMAERWLSTRNKQLSIND